MNRQGVQTKDYAKVFEKKIRAQNVLGRYRIYYNFCVDLE